ncbi:hypothetical protein N9R90_00590 [Flavobacteriaceae bacterium]|nr:hypothetical protein [Flavobacteriaceae bacterium]
MKLHPNYIKALEERYKDFSYSETIEMIKKNRLYGAASSKYTIQSLPKDRVWSGDINLEKFKKLYREQFIEDDFMELLTDDELNQLGFKPNNNFMWVSSKKVKLYMDNWDDKQWWEDYHNGSNEIELKNIEDDFNKSKGEEFSGIIYNHLIDFTSLIIDDEKVKSIINYIEDKNDFEDKLKKKVIEIDEWEMAKGYLLSLDESEGYIYSSDARIYYSELTIKENKNLEILMFIKDYNGEGIDCDGTLNIQGIYNDRDYIKHTIEKNVKFLNPINGKWENFLLEFDGEHSESVNYNYTHHLGDDKFDFSKDFPEEDKLNKALKLHLEYIKKYGKE